MKNVNDFAKVFTASFSAPAITASRVSKEVKEGAIAHIGTVKNSSAIKGRKELYTDVAEVKAAANVKSSVNSELQKIALYTSNGLHHFPIAKFEEVSAIVKTGATEHAKAIDAIISKRDEILKTCESNLGADLFDLSDYETVAQLEAKKATYKLSLKPDLSVLAQLIDFEAIQDESLTVFQDQQAAEMAQYDAEIKRRVESACITILPETLANGKKPNKRSILDKIQRYQPDTKGSTLGVPTIKKQLLESIDTLELCVTGNSDFVQLVADIKNLIQSTEWVKEVFKRDRMEFAEKLKAIFGISTPQAETPEIEASDVETTIDDAGTVEVNTAVEGDFEAPGEYEDFEPSDAELDGIEAESLEASF